MHGGVVDADFDFADVEFAAVALGELHQDLVGALLVVDLGGFGVVSQQGGGQGGVARGLGFDGEKVVQVLTADGVGVGGLFAELDRIGGAKGGLVESDRG